MKPGANVSPRPSVISALGGGSASEPTAVMRPAPSKTTDPVSMTSSGVRMRAPQITQLIGSQSYYGRCRPPNVTTGRARASYPLGRILPMLNKLLAPLDGTPLAEAGFLWAEKAA